MNKQQLAERRALYEAIRTRIRLVAHERNLPKSEIKPAMGLRQEPLLEFVRRHRLSLDWLLDGDLRGLLRMAKRSPKIIHLGWLS